MLAAVTVTNNSDVVNGDTTSIDALIASDGGDGISLREAIEAANMDAGSDIIDFSVKGKITLSLGELEVVESVSIYGPETESLIISAEGSDPTPSENNGDGSRIFTVRSVSRPDLLLGTFPFLEIHNLALTGGDVNGPGGAIWVSPGTFVTNSNSAAVYNSFIYDNYAVEDGGGIHSASGTALLRVENSTLTGNFSGGDGGAIAGSVFSALVDGVLSRRLHIESSTITRNTASLEDGGIALEFGGASIKNTIVGENTAIDLEYSDLAQEHFSTFSDYDFSHSLIGIGPASIIAGAPLGFPDGDGNLVGDTSIPIDPRLGPLTNNGGPTKTHALLSGSPAIDAGDPGIVAPPGYDQRGAPYQRIADGDADGTSRIDIGAFEVPTTFIVTTELDEFDGVIDPNLGGAMSLREAITLANLTPQPINITFDPSLDGATIMLDQLNLGALPTITDNLSIDAVNLVNGLTIHAGHGLDATSNTGDGIRIFEIDDGDEDSSSDFALFGLILSGGDISGSGGAIRSTENLTLVDSTISNNAATSTGGGVSIFGNLTVHNSEISKNFSDLGGGIQQATGDLSIRQSSISGNMAGQGGGILSAASKVEIADSSISGNYVSGFTAGAAAISVSLSTMDITRSTISDNHAVGYHDSIGSVWSRDSEVTLTFSTVSGNTDQASEEPTGGGGIRINGGKWTIQYSTISGNSTNGRGGGINNEEGELLILHSTITNNYAPEGYGSGISSKSGTSTELFSSAIVGNVNSDIDVEGSTNPFVSDGYNLIGTGDAVAVFNQPGDQTGILDPLLGPLADNGGPTMTHALLLGSPALDAGNGGGATDQRGMTAPIDLPGIANAPAATAATLGLTKRRLRQRPILMATWSSTGSTFSSGNAASA